MKNFITEFKKILTEIRVNIFNLLRWCIFATLVGLFVGGISVAFSALGVSQLERSLGCSRAFLPFLQMVDLMVKRHLMVLLHQRLGSVLVMDVPCMNAPSLEALKARLDGALGSLSWWGAALPTAGVGVVWALSSLPTQIIL